MSIRRKFASNVAYLFLDWVLATLFSIFFWAVIAKNFLPDISGIVSAATNLVMSISGIASLGLTAAVHKLIPEYLEKKQKLKVVGVIRYSLKIVFVTTLAVSIIFFIFSDSLALIFNIPSDAINAIAPFLIVQSLFILSSSIIRGFQNMRRFAATNLVGHITKVCFVILFTILGFSYLGAIAGYFLSLLLVFFLRLDYMFLRSQSKEIYQQGIIFDYALPALATTIASVLIKNGQYIILTMLQSTEVTGIFTIAMLISSPMLVLPTILSLAISPILSQLSVGKNAELQSSLLKSVFRYIMFISLPLSILIVMFSKNLIFLFSRIEYVSASELLPIIALASIFYAAGDAFYAGLYAIGQAKIQRNILVVTSVIFLLISLPFTYVFSAIGMSISYAIAMSILFFLGYTYMRKFIKFDLDCKALLKILSSSVVLLVFLFAISRFVYNLFSVVLFAVLGSFAYLLALIPLKFYTEEDVKVLRFLGEKMPALSKVLNGVADTLSKLI